MVFGCWLVERGGLVAERAWGAEGQGLCSRSPVVAGEWRGLWECNLSSLGGLTLERLPLFFVTHLGRSAGS